MQIVHASAALTASGAALPIGGVREEVVAGGVSDAVKQLAAPTAPVAGQRQVASAGDIFTWRGRSEQLLDTPGTFGYRTNPTAVSVEGPGVRVNRTGTALAITQGRAGSQSD